MNLSPARGMPAQARRDYAAFLAGPRLDQSSPQEATAAHVPVYDDADPVVHLALAVAAILLEATARDELGLVAEAAAWLGEQGRPPASLPPGGPACSGEPLTRGETRVLRYLPTCMSAPEIAAELCVSANTVKTHVYHLYRKLGAHNRQEAVRRARAIGLLAASRTP
jgi:DNA-binding NarL/FixJ family response regulator